MKVDNKYIEMATWDCSSPKSYILQLESTVNQRLPLTIQ